MAGKGGILPTEMHPLSLATHNDKRQCVRSKMGESQKGLHIDSLLSSFNQASRTCAKVWRAFCPPKSASCKPKSQTQWAKRWDGLLLVWFIANPHVGTPCSTCFPICANLRETEV